MIGWSVSGQKLFLDIRVKNISEVRIIDSVEYSKVHVNKKSIDDEVANFSDKLIKKGFIDVRVLNKNKVNDSSFVYEFELGNRTEKIHIYIGKNSELKGLGIFESKTDTLVKNYFEIENYLNNGLKKLEIKGYALSKLQLKNIARKNKHLEAELFLIADKKRILNEVVIKGYDKFPEGFKKNRQQTYRKLTFNKENLKKIFDDFNSMRFVKQTKYPEILFTTDSTKVFVYVEKAKNNTFDGFIGFANDENKNLIFTGYVDLALNNALNIGEKLNLYWKSDGQNQKTFNVLTEVPFIFKSPIGIKAQLNIFRQDSIFQSTKTSLDLGYFLNLKSKVYLGYQETESNDISNLNTSILSDSKNAFVTLAFEYVNFNREAKEDDILFPEKTNFNLKLGSGQRNAKTQKDYQYFVNFNINHHLYLDKHNAINLKSKNYYLKSGNYLTNELYRFGGINSIRGFNENSLQCNFLTSLMTEYQYVVSNSFYLHSVLDYGYFDDKATKKSDKLLGLGIGFGIVNKNGILNFVYANGSLSNQAIKFSNSVVQVSLKTSF